MLRKARIAVVVPAYDAARFIGSVVRTMPEFVDSILVIDDGSRDATGEAARAPNDPRVRLVRHDRNRGVGAAITTGYAEALALGSDVVAVMAGDGQMDPADLARIVGPVIEERAEYVSGDRLSDRDNVRAMPWTRRLGNRLLAALSRWALGLPGLRDSQCGYTAIAGRTLRRLDLAALYPRYGYPNDLLSRLVLAGARIAHVPVRAIYDGQPSGVRLWHALLTIPWLLLRCARRRLGAMPRPNALGAECASDS